ncbi:MAG: hypothetical protein PCFJNLEI_04231 [Verrucomicrobiae bacterium]|nr:hypothetical protein [Verrucomicrobiae bacterium]
MPAVPLALKFVIVELSQTSRLPIGVYNPPLTCPASALKKSVPLFKRTTAPDKLLADTFPMTNCAPLLMLIVAPLRPNAVALVNRPRLLTLMKSLLAA